MKKMMLPVMKKEVPVYYTNSDTKVLGLLPAILDKKSKEGKGLVKIYLETLDSVEIQGGECILYSTERLDTLLLSVA